MHIYRDSFPIHRQLSVQEVAKILGISPRTIWNQTAPGSNKKFPIKFRRVGRLIRFRPEDVSEYLEKE